MNGTRAFFLAGKMEGPPNEPQYDGKYCLCFPSISTNAFKFDLEVASTVACKVIGEFLKENPDERIRVYLLDMTESYTLRKFREVCTEAISHQFFLLPFHG